MVSAISFHLQAALFGLGDSRRKALLAAGIVLWLAPWHGLAAEVIYLKNGEVIVGRVVAQTATQMRVETRNGVRVFQKTTIQRVSYSSAEEQAALARETAAADEAERRAAAARAAEARKQAEAVRTDPGRAAETPGPLGLTLRSAALPGLGHIALGKPYTGGAYMGLTAAALVNAFAQRSAALAAETKNSADVNLNFALAFAPDALDITTRLAINLYLNGAAQTPYRAAIDRYDQSLLIVGVVYVWQLAHIVYDAWFADAIVSAASAMRAPDAAGWRFAVAPERRDPEDAALRSAAAMRGDLAGSLSYVFIF